VRGEEGGEGEGEGERGLVNWTCFFVLRCEAHLYELSGIKLVCSACGVACSH